LKLVSDADEKFVETIAFVPPVSQQLQDEDVLAALKKIPESFSEVVVLTDVEELSYREVAELLTIPMGTVMSRLHRGRKLLRQELSREAPITKIPANS
jgi:RNA polymerase sigma-70 factor (ECF subfamily)